VTLFVISDLHIQAPEDPFYASLLSLLRERTVSGDIVVLAGDLFDVFVGDKPVFLSRYRDFLNELVSAGQRGVRIHYIEGNHDFLVKRAYSDIHGVEVHSHDVTFEIAGKRFFFAHGDTVDRADIGYMALRLFFRSPLMRAIVKVVPGSWLERIGRVSSRRSRASQPEWQTRMSLTRMERLRVLYRNFAAEKLAHGFDYVVLGHCHDLDEMSFSIGERSGQYVNVGYPRIHGSFLTWSPGDERIQREKLPRGLSS
jgi:UDP-2,3-diacylglucosamine hydrolase